MRAKYTRSALEHYGCVCGNTPAAPVFKLAPHVYVRLLYAKAKDQPT